MAEVQQQLVPDEAARQTLFPVTKSGIFLAHAGVAPLPRVAAEKVQFEAHRAMSDNQETGETMRELNATRDVAAQLIGAKPSEIALIGPTALGLNMVAAGLSWAPGDEVVYYPGDYPSNVYPWLNLANYGVKTVGLQPELPGALTPELVLAAVTAKTKLVALASCHFLTGYRLDVAAIGTALKERGVLFCVDGIQSLGATRLDCQHFDFLAADSHKWLLGPLGAGILYVKESRFAELRPALLGSLNVVSPNFVAQTTIEFPDHARRYECGAYNALGIFGMRASMEMLLALGLDNIQNRLLQLHAYAANLFREAGFTVLSDRFPEGAKSGIVTIHKPGTDLAPLFAALQKRKITASLRWGLDQQAYLRFSPHFYNTESELDATVAALKEAKA